MLPGLVAAPVLTQAIARHSWTFAGTGRSGWRFAAPGGLGRAQSVGGGWSAETPSASGMWRCFGGSMGGWSGRVCKCARWRAVRAVMRPVGSRFRPGSPPPHPLPTEGRGGTGRGGGRKCQRRACGNVILARLESVRLIDSMSDALIHPPQSWPEPRAMLTLIKPITWFPPVWAYLCGAVSFRCGLWRELGTVLLGMVLAGRWSAG